MEIEAVNTSRHAVRGVMERVLGWRHDMSTGVPRGKIFADVVSRTTRSPGRKRGEDASHPIWANTRMVMARGIPSLPRGASGAGPRASRRSPKAPGGSRWDDAWRSSSARLIQCPDGDGSRHPARFREGLRERVPGLPGVPRKPPAEAGGVTRCDQIYRAGPPAAARSLQAASRSPPRKAPARASIASRSRRRGSETVPIP
jgi:hypothetical protein